MPSFRVLAISVLRASPSLAPKPFESLVDHEQNFEETTSKTTLGSCIELSVRRLDFVVFIPASARASGCSAQPVPCRQQIAVLAPRNAYYIHPEK